MEGKFTRVQPEPGPEEQRSDKKERGIAMDVTPRDSSSLLQPVQGAGHIENEETSSDKLTAYSGLKKKRYRPTATPHLDEKQSVQVRARYFSSLLVPRCTPPR